MTKPIIVLFSGGVESTLLTQQLLNQGKTVVGVYGEMKWAVEVKQTYKIQNQVVEKLSEYFKSKYENQFILHKFSIEADIIERMPGSFIWGRNDQWGIFFASMLCPIYGAEEIWKGEYTSTVLEQIETGRDGRYHQLNLSSWDRDLERYVEYGLGHSFFPKPRILFPAIVWRHKELDRFNTRTELFNELDPYLKKYVRSCISDTWFCDKCGKCMVWNHGKIINEKPSDIEE
jgi:hypothetical protein